MASKHTTSPLDLPLPALRHQALGLLLIRRMTSHGQHDTRAAMLAMDVAGARFRKLLVLARAFMVDLGTTSQRRIRLAPFCAGGMTRDEGLIVDLFETGRLDVLAALTDDARSITARESGLAFGAELRDLACRKGWKF